MTILSFLRKVNKKIELTSSDVAKKLYFNEIKNNSINEDKEIKKSFEKTKLGVHLILDS